MNAHSLGHNTLTTVALVSTWVRVQRYAHVTSHNIGEVYNMRSTVGRRLAQNLSHHCTDTSAPLVDHNLTSLPFRKPTSGSMLVQGRCITRNTCWGEHILGEHISL